jgi:hypothetical protein
MTQPPDPDIGTLGADAAAICDRMIAICDDMLVVIERLKRKRDEAQERGFGPFEPPP